MAGCTKTSRRVVMQAPHYSIIKFLVNWVTHLGNYDKHIRPSNPIEILALESNKDLLIEVLACNSAGIIVATLTQVEFCGSATPKQHHYYAWVSSVPLKTIIQLEHYNSITLVTFQQRMHAWREHAELSGLLLLLTWLVQHFCNFFSYIIFR